jgi:RHS repeat-associated protein
LGLDFTRRYSSLDTSAGPLGPGWSHPFEQHLTFNGDGSITLTDASGNAVPFLSDGNAGFYPATGVLSRLTTPAPGQYRVDRPDHVVENFDSTGRLTGEVDRNNNQISFSYTNGDVTTITDTVGRTIALGYDPSHRLTSLQDPLTNSVIYAYDPSGRLQTVRDLSGGTTTYAYDPSGRLASILDPNGHFLVRNTYGADGRVSQQLDALGNPTTYGWDAATLTSTMTDARNGAWVEVYNDDGSLRSSRDPLGNTTSYTYDAMLSRATVTDARGHTTTNTFDGLGHQLKSVAPAPFGYITTYEWDTNGNLHGTTDPKGNTTWQDYDSAGNLIRITLPLPGAPAKTFAYDPSGNGLLVSTTDPRAKTTTYGYDAQANRTRVTTPLGFSTTMTYDADGRMISRVDPRGNVTGADPIQYTTTFSYDGRGRLRTVIDALNHTTTTAYDTAGNRLSVTDANSHTTTFSYDEANELTSVTDPRLKVTAYTYDVVGNLASRTDAKNHLTSFGYDLARRLTSETTPLNRVWTYAYDANGNRTQIVDAIGNSTPQTGDGTTTFTYDNIDRLAGITYSDATQAVTFVYDANGNRTSMNDGVSNNYTYDALNRPTQIGRSPNLTIDYTYDAAGNVLTRYPFAGWNVTYTYDDDGRLATMTANSKTTTYSYDAAGNVTTTTLPAANGYVETRTYDRAGRLTEVKNTKGASTLSKATYTLDAVGNRSTIVTTTGTTNLTYDLADRPTQACYTVQCTGPGDNFRTYTYDDVGNRLTEAQASGTTTYTYDALDQLSSSAGPGGNISYTYDLDGNETAAGSRTFTYDLPGRLKTTTSGTTTYTYTYDGDGHRMSAATGPQANKTTKFVWDSNRPVPEVVQEQDGNGAHLREYQYGLDLVSMNVGTSGSFYHFHHDGLGSVVNVTSATGATQWTYEYHPYGTARTTTKNSGSAPTNFMQFAGEYFDPTGLYHLRARQYDPSTGRFLSTDPVTQSLARSYFATYVYSNDQPTRLTDPSGRDTGGLCLGGQLFVIFGGGVQVCVVFTTDYEVGITVTPELGIGSPNVSYNGGVQKSNAESINDLGQLFDIYGGSVGEIVGPSGEVFTGSGHCGQAVQGTTLGFGATVKGPPAEVHRAKSYTLIPLNIDLGGIFGDRDAGCSPGRPPK